MSSNNKIGEVFSCLIRDRKIVFILLAAILLTFSMFTSYVLNDIQDSLEKSFFIGITFAFTSVVFAWAVTDKSVLRKPSLYISLFLVLLFEKIYIGLSANLSDFIYNSDKADITQINSYYLFIIINFFVMLYVFLVIWYLSKPKEFKTYKSKNIFLIIFSVFLITLPTWFFRFLACTYSGFSGFCTQNPEVCSLLFQGIPIALSLVIFAMVITNIKSIVRNILYFIIFVFTLAMYLPGFISDFPETLFFIFAGFCISVVFLSFVLLSKPRYIDI